MLSWEQEWFQLYCLTSKAVRCFCFKVTDLSPELKQMLELSWYLYCCKFKV